MMRKGEFISPIRKKVNSISTVCSVSSGDVRERYERARQDSRRPRF